MDTWCHLKELQRAMEDRERESKESMLLAILDDVTKRHRNTANESMDSYR